MCVPAAAARRGAGACAPGDPHITSQRPPAGRAAARPPVTRRCPVRGTMLSRLRRAPAAANTAPRSPSPVKNDTSELTETTPVTLPADSGDAAARADRPDGAAAAEVVCRRPGDPDKGHRGHGGRSASGDRVPAGPHDELAAGSTATNGCDHHSPDVDTNGAAAETGGGPGERPAGSGPEEEAVPTQPAPAPRRASTWSVSSSMIDLRDKYGPQLSSRFNTLRDKVQ